jgi:cytidine deaminase
MGQACLTNDERAKLMKAARDTVKHAYAPYSNFRVGAAVLTEKGELFSGCNVENASYRLTACAEQVAIYSAITRRGKDMRIRAIAVVSESGADCPPCGACRQVIAEFGPDAIIIFQTRAGMEEMHISELLPKGFVAKKKMNK